MVEVGVAADAVMEHVEAAVEEAAEEEAAEEVVEKDTRTATTTPMDKVNVGNVGIHPTNMVHVLPKGRYAGNAMVGTILSRFAGKTTKLGKMRYSLALIPNPLTLTSNPNMPHHPMPHHPSTITHRHPVVMIIFW